MKLSLLIESSVCTTLTDYSSIDAVTEQKIMKLIAERLPKKTVISVLHRLEAALEYPRILVLEGGQVTHFGTSTEVREKSNLFSALRK